MIYGHTRGCYVAINQALEELHGSPTSHPILAKGVETEVSARCAKILRTLDIYSIQHLLDYDLEELTAETREDPSWDYLVALEIARVLDKYRRVLDAEKEKRPDL